MEKLLLLIEKLETQINRLIKTVMLTPLKIVSKEKLLFPFFKISEMIQKILDFLKDSSRDLFGYIFSSTKKIKKNFQYYLGLFLQSLKIFRTQGFTKSYEFIKEEISAFSKRLIHKIENLGPKKFFFLSLFVMFAILNGFHLVSSSKKFVGSLPFMQKAAILPPINKLPDYYNFQQKKVRMNEVKFPLFINGPKRMKHLNLDLTVEFSNRTSQMYFLKNRIIFQDHLQLTLEPMDPQFSLSDEGKNIQRQKIKYEIDSVLKSREIAGEVQAVHIEYLLVN